LKQLKLLCGNVFARRLPKKYLHLYTQGTWLFGDWDKALRAAGFVPDKMRLHKFWDHKKVIKKIRACETETSLSILVTRYRINPACLKWGDATTANGVRRSVLWGHQNISTARRNLLKELRYAFEQNSGTAIFKSSKLQLVPLLRELAKRQVCTEDRH
jgi:hypothetical protein